MALIKKKEQKSTSKVALQALLWSSLVFSTRVEQINTVAEEHIRQTEKVYDTFKCWTCDNQVNDEYNWLDRNLFFLVYKIHSHI